MISNSCIHSLGGAVANYTVYSQSIDSSKQTGGRVGQPIDLQPLLNVETASPTHL